MVGDDAWTVDGGGVGHLTPKCVPVLRLRGRHVAFATAALLGLLGPGCVEGREAAEVRSATTTIDGIPGVERPRECETDRAIAEVCARLETIAGDVIRPVSGSQLALATITVLPDRRVRYEERIRDEDAFSLDTEVESFEIDLKASSWTPLPGNSPPRLRYQLLEATATYVLTLTLRTEPGALDGDLQLFVDAIVETAGPVTAR